MIISDSAINRPALTPASALAGIQASALVSTQASAPVSTQASRASNTRKQAWSYRIFEICDMSRPLAVISST
jgi:hypothetical protein